MTLRLFLLIAVACSCFAQSTPSCREDTPPQKPAQTAAPETSETSVAPATISEVKFEERPLLTVDVLMVSLPAEKMFSLLPELRDDGRIVAAQETLLQMVARKEATVLDWPSAHTHPGGQGVSESITEKRYAVGFAFPAAEAAEKEAKEPDISLDAGSPTEFESRNVGSELNFLGAISPDGKSATIQIWAQIVLLDREERHLVGKTAKGEEVQITQPIFMTDRAAVNLTLKDGERRLIYSSAKVEGREMGRVFIAGLRITPAK